MLLVLLLAIIWFATGKKRLSLLAFFALLTNGFMLVPDIAYTVVANLKPSDYGILYIISVSIIAYIKNKDCYKDRLYLPRYTIFLLSFLFVSYLVSVFLYHIPAFESLKYVRKYILLLAPFAFALYTTEEIEDTIKTLFKITVIQCILYLLQPILDMQLLTGTYTEGKTPLFGIISIPRFYNIPLYLWFFIYYLCYKHDTSDKYRFFLVILMFLPVIVSMHRSHLIAYISVFILSAAIAHLRKSLPLVVILLVIAVPFSSMVSDKLARNESLTDIKGAFEIDYEDFSVGQDGEAQNALNQVRTRAKMSPVTATGTKLRDAIRQERRLELAFEQNRLYDIRRWKDDSGQPVIASILGPNGSFVQWNMNEETRDSFEWNNQGEASNKGATFDINRDMVFPIPLYEITQSNGSIEQNPGWN